MMTRPITTPNFQARVLALLDSYFEAVSNAPSPEAVPYPLVAPLTPEDTTLAPDEYISTMIAVSAPWIDLASQDPVIAHVSRQVFNHEIAFAAFCGVNNVMIQGPNLETSAVISQYARSLSHALEVGPYIQLQVLLPMQPNDSSVCQEDLNLAGRARDAYLAKETAPNDELRSWDAWELIRSTCKYHVRLSVGKLKHLLRCVWRCDEPLGVAQIKHIQQKSIIAGDKTTIDLNNTHTNNLFQNLNPLANTIPCF